MGKSADSRPEGPGGSLTVITPRGQSQVLSSNQKRQAGENYGRETEGATGRVDEKIRCLNSVVVQYQSSI